MVSFSCEACGDVLTKKKLDPHRGQCRGASYTCIDCMVHFYGTEYRAHTSCMSEEQKYQGALYKEKPAKGQKKGQNNKNANAKANANARNQQPRVESASESDNVIVKSVDAPPPPAPTPPPVVESKPTAEALKNSGKDVNVFDYLVTEETPNASKTSLAPPKEQMSMVKEAPSLFKASTSLAKLDAKSDDEGNYDIAYEENGFSYGADPIPPSMYPSNVPNDSTEFVTPAPKKKKDRRKEEKRAPGSVSEKKRKRGQEETFNSPQQDIDTDMMDAPSSVINNAGTPILNHSGLTGGLNRMMRSPSHELDDTPAHGSPHGNGDPGLGITIKNRAERLVSSMFGGTGSVISASSDQGSRPVVRSRRGSDSSGDVQLEVRKKKSHRTRTASDNLGESRKSKRKSSNPTDGDRPSRRLKQTDDDPHHDNHEVTVYRQSKPPARAEDVMPRELAGHFLSLVSRDTERGCSVHKALKRFHRDFTDGYVADRSRDNRRSHANHECRSEDEKDLWRALRLRRNDRGEIVVFA
ncbi:uncharacterized protein N7483_003752 [Penicillium malachiteum]|uniref:uncharacterized protein n=1 Tax=Penicillium malachiteum TaxID=1324776 RepID=UPI0025476F78|nr:uncharacterized protein N7483_003752 [Penicillium malachiteum]KAJ5729244.1 hypothetical protein N7483_003752 [Penicillium malachiteum]